MFQIEKFSKLPKHQSLLDRAAKVITSDSRVIGLYVYGSPNADEYSDVDLSIFFKTDEERKSFRNDIEKITKKIGKVKVETVGVNDERIYIVIFDPEELNIDMKFMLIYEDDNPYEFPVDIIYDPEGHLEKMVKDAPKLVIDIDRHYLDHGAKQFYYGFLYFVLKVGRGQFWRALDVIDLYRRGLIKDEDVLARRLHKDYLDVEKNLDEERIAVLNKTLISELTKENLFQAMDAMIEYWDRFLKDKFQELGLLPEEYASSMTEYYERKKKEILCI